MVVSVSFDGGVNMMVVGRRRRRRGRLRQRRPPGRDGDPGALDMGLALKTSVPAATPAPHVYTLLLCLVSTILAPHHPI